jgi:hypothetical protein
MHKTDERIMSCIRIYQGPYQASDHIQLKTSCRDISLREHDVYNYKTSIVGSYIRIDMHIDKRHPCI